jgi:hypothetical protein
VDNTLTARHRSLDEIVEGLHLARRSPRGVGTVALAVRRPAVDAREVLSRAELDPDLGLIGDSWIRLASPVGLPANATYSDAWADRSARWRRHIRTPGPAT